MKLYNCPDCHRDDSCDGCYRVNYLPVNTHYAETAFIPNDPCAKCSNNPANGGSGICHCILGLPKIT